MVATFLKCMTKKLSEVERIWKIVTQALVKHQFPSVNGLQSTITITKCSFRYLESECSSFLQVVNVSGNHWVVASNIGSSVSEVTVYDSLFTTANKDTSLLLNWLLATQKKIKIYVVRPQIQSGYHDCGLFALAFSMSLVTGQDVFRYFQSNFIFTKSSLSNYSYTFVTY